MLLFFIPWWWCLRFWNNFIHLYILCSFTYSLICNSINKNSLSTYYIPGGAVRFLNTLSFWFQRLFSHCSIELCGRQNSKMASKIFHSSVIHTLNNPQGCEYNEFNFPILWAGLRRRHERELKHERDLRWEILSIPETESHMARI